jgi:hypothetical protein
MCRYEASVSKQRDAIHGRRYALRTTSQTRTDELSWQTYSYNVASKLQDYTAHLPLAHQITGSLSSHASPPTFLSCHFLILTPKYALISAI